MYWFWGNTAAKEMSQTIWVWCPLIIIIIPILKHFIDGIITGHLVFELVKLPPPNGDEERPEKVSLLQPFQYSDILGIATSVCHQFDADYNHNDNNEDQTIPRAGGRKGS